MSSRKRDHRTPERRRFHAVTDPRHFENDAMLARLVPHDQPTPWDEVIWRVGKCLQWWMRLDDNTLRRIAEEHRQRERKNLARVFGEEALR